MMAMRFFKVSTTRRNNSKLIWRSIYKITGPVFIVSIAVAFVAEVIDSHGTFLDCRPGAAFTATESVRKQFTVIRERKVFF